jgi:hypothetical protein
MKRSVSMIAVGAMALAMAACGHTTTERAVTGAAIGAGTGAVLSGTATGAVVGGAAGAAVGAATTPPN